MARNGERKKRRFPLFRLLLVVLLAAACFRWYGPAVQWLAGTARVWIFGQAEMPAWVDIQLIDIDGASRSGIRLERVEDIVIHYVGNPSTTAQQNHDYYCNSESSVSSHFLVGLRGEVIQCVPLDEKSAASNWRNADTISIEVCHPDETGKFTQETYDALVKLTAWLLETGYMDETDIIRHYDITGKLCPLYFVENPESWEAFKEDVARALP